MRSSSRLSTNSAPSASPTASAGTGSTSSTLQLTQGDLSGYVSPCQEEALPTPRQALTLMAAFFRSTRV